jgi:methylated-DNA-[protein]-cysteine S-methyltransferase
MTQEISMKTPIGLLLIEGDDEAITHITLPDSSRQPAQRHAQGLSPETSEGASTPAAVAAAVTQLAEYFAGDRTEFDLSLELEGTAFQKDVWLALGEIPYGKTVSYAELAGMVGRPTAFRAVGQANGANPIPIVLPCHRVLASGGGIGGYGGGLPMKRQLLAIEGVTGIG